MIVILLGLSVEVWFDIGKYCTGLCIWF